MSSFDPNIVRKAVEEFTPGRPQRFQDLMPAKDVIKELRQKRASYRAIATLLTKHCLPTSKTAIAAFCHQMLGEIVRPHRRSGRRRTTATAQANGEESATLEQQLAGEHSPTAAPAGSNGGEAPSARVRGPRIAQVRLLKPQST